MVENDFKTLAERLTEGRLPVADALRLGNAVGGIPPPPP